MNYPGPFPEEQPEPAERFAAASAAALRALAGPGTGKTYALIRRVARLLEEGARPRRLLVVTFARTAARDLVAAVARIEAEAEELIPRTLHSFCFGLLGRQGVLHATGRVPRIALVFERDMLLADLQHFGTLTEKRALLQAFEAAWARQQVDEPGEPVPGLDQCFQDSLLRLLRWYRAMLVGEVVPIALSYLRNNPQASEREAYDHVLVDEYQDLNRAEQEVLNLLSGETNLAVIGDDDQSIYQFKHANPEGIRTFDQEHPGTEDVEFVICRRCPHRVVEMAQVLVERNPGRVRSPLRARSENPPGEIHHVQWTSVDEEAEGIARFVRAQIERGVEPGGCLILAPRRQIGYAIRDALTGRGVACSSFFREEAVGSEAAQETLTLLTLLGHPDDRLALRTWFALGSSTQRRGPYRRLLEAAWEHNCDVAEIMRRLEAEQLRIPYTVEALERWRELQRRQEELADYIEDLPALLDLVLPGEDEELALLRSTAEDAVQEAETLEDFLAAVRYGVSQREVPLEATEARVMSLHASKGLTADLVILAGLVEGLIPYVDPDASVEEQEAQLQEQRRVFYVGMTRTRNTLVLSSYSQLDTATAMSFRAARGRRIGGGFRVVASRFLSELGSELPSAVRGSEWRY